MISSPICSELTDRELLIETQNAASQEKSATLVFLDHLAEVDRRRLYALSGYSSLFEYVNKELGYSEAQSSERISAMRLMRGVPEVKTALKTQALTLTSVAKIASHVRREKAGIEGTLILLKKCEGKSTREIERVLVENVVRMCARPERKQLVSPNFTRIAFDADEECTELLTRIRELKGNPGLSVGEVLKIVLRDYIRRLEVRRGMRAPKKLQSVALRTSGARSAVRGE